MKKLLLTLALVGSVSTQSFADNTNQAVTKDKNETERSNKTNITAQDQPSDEQQTQLIANIREALVDREDLSVASKNVLVVARGPSHVFVRGDVPSLQEKNLIITVAKNFATVVDDSLTVNEAK